MSGNAIIQERRVLVLYTGGTIGMLNTPRGFDTNKSFLSSWLASQTSFHDPAAETICSHSHDAAAFASYLNRDQPQASCSTDQTTPTPSSPISIAAINPPATLSSSYDPSSPTLSLKNLRLDPVNPELHLSNSPTRESSIGRGRGRSFSNHKERNASGSNKGLRIDPGIAEERTVGEEMDSEYISHLVTPCFQALGGGLRRIRYTIFEYDPLVGSSSIDPVAWLKISKDILNHSHLYDGFIVLHGTDTMPYTASALAFLLQGLAKPVVITGAQIPLCEFITDAVNNLRGALLAASREDLKEVCIYFADKLFRGVRTKKVSSFELDAFDSPHMEPLVRAGVEIGPQLPELNFKALPAGFVREMSSEVTVLQLYPGINVETLRASLLGGARAVVMQTYGAGNFPLEAKLLDVIKEAVEAEVLIVNVSQCARGKVLPVYLANIALTELGVVVGGDMTPECAFVKAAYMLAQKQLTLAEKKRWMAISMVGEMSTHL